jgi:D-serine deaminase-like pyridoxal phosphate-dependent protein
MSWENTYLTYSAALREVPRPTAFVDLEALEENIQKVLKYSGDRPIRLATKSIRCLPLLKDIQASSSRFIGFMTFSARESLYLSQQGLNDFLIGYPFMQAAEVKAYVELRQQGKRAIAMVDSFEQAEAISYGLRGTKVEGLVCLDVDASSDWGWLYFGVRRSPLRWEEGVLALAQSLRRLENIRIVGVMAYEAQIAGLPDRGLGLKTPLVRFLKRRSWQEVQKRRQAIVAALRDAGFALEFVNGGERGACPSRQATPASRKLRPGQLFLRQRSLMVMRGFSFGRRRASAWKSPADPLRISSPVTEVAMWLLVRLDRRSSPVPGSPPRRGSYPTRAPAKSKHLSTSPIPLLSCGRASRSTFATQRPASSASASRCCI